MDSSLDTLAGLIPLAVTAGIVTRVTDSSLGRNSFAPRNFTDRFLRSMEEANNKKEGTRVLAEYSDELSKRASITRKVARERLESLWRSYNRTTG